MRDESKKKAYKFITGILTRRNVGKEGEGTDEIKLINRIPSDKQKTKTEYEIISY